MTLKGMKSSVVSAQDLILAERERCLKCVDDEPEDVENYRRGYTFNQGIETAKRNIRKRILEGAEE